MNPWKVAFGLGFLLLILETVLFRELFCLLGGNEFTIGWMYLVWFVFSGLGIFVLGERPLAMSKIYSKQVDRWFFFYPYILCAAIFFIALLEQLFPFNVGKLISLEGVFVVISFVLCFPALFSGVGFALIVEYLSEADKLFRWEAFGFAIAACFVFMGIDILGLSMYYIAAIAVLFIIYFVINKYKSFFWVFELGLTVSFLLFFPYLKTSNISSFKGNCITQQDSIFGRVEIRNLHGEPALFYNGILISNFDEKHFSELSVHPACLQLVDYTSALIIGDLARGVAKEAAKYPFKEVIVLERDPILAMIDRFLYKKLGSVKVSLLRNMVQLRRKKFSFIFVGYTNPLTIAKSRYLSVEFFKKLRHFLEPSGILTLPVDGNVNFINKELLEYTAVVFSTLKSVFRYVKYIPGSPAIFLASDTKLSLNKEFFQKQLKKKAIKTNYFCPYYWDLFLQPIRLHLQYARIKAISSGNKKINSIRYPVAFDKYFTFYLSMMGKREVDIWNDWKKFSVFFILSFLFFTPILSLGYKDETRVYSQVFWSSFIHMSMYLITVLWLQGLYGTFYGDVMVLTGAYMLGLALGTFFTFIFKRYWSFLFLLGMILLFLVSVIPEKCMLLLFVLGQALVQGAFISFQMRNVKLNKQIYFWDLIGSGLAAFLVGPTVLVEFGLVKFVFLLLISIIFGIVLFRRKYIISY